MSVNKDRPHLLVLPEDEANLRLATEFHLQVDPTRQRKMQVLKPAGGWNQVLQIFEEVHVAEMERCPNRFMLLLIDFDGNENRLQQVQNSIPQHLTERIFVLGSLIDPETLRHRLGSFKQIGEHLAADCRENTNETWGDAHLQHNAGELERLREQICPFLFPAA